MQGDFLERHQNIFFHCVQDCSEPVMISDKMGKLIYINPAWTEVYGYSWDEAVGSTPALLRSRHQDQDFYTKMWDAILNPKIGRWKGELINRSKSGEEVPVLLTITPYRDERGHNVGYMGIALDLREKRNLELQVAQQDRLATIGILTSGLAHEIGTPMGVIRGRAEMLSMDLEKNPSATKDLQTIIKQTDRISNLISTLLRLSRSGSDVSLMSLKVDDALEEIVDLLRPKFEKAKAKIEVLKNPSLIVKTDRERLEQILLNLMINSLHAIEKQKEILPDHKGALIVSTESSDAHWILRVKDNGCGMDKSTHEKIFDPFFTTKPAGKGTGLGLAVVMRILHELGGTISCDTEKGQGAEFSLTFPQSL